MKKHLFFLIALGVQTLILVAMPLGRMYALSTGQEVKLRLAPVDPFDMWSGYFVTLRYDVSRPDSLAGWKSLKEGDTVYITLQKGEDGAFKAQSVSKNKPSAPLFLKGEMKDAELKFGIEAYFIPEAKRDAIQQNIDANRGKGFGVISLDANGNAALKHLVVNKQVYDF